MNQEDYVVDGASTQTEKLHMDSLEPGASSSMSPKSPIMGRFQRSSSGGSHTSISEADMSVDDPSISLDLSSNSRSQSMLNISDSTKQFLQSLRGESTRVVIDLISVKLLSNPLCVDKVLQLLAVNGVFEETEGDDVMESVTESAAEEDDSDEHPSRSHSQPMMMPAPGGHRAPSPHLVRRMSVNAIKAPTKPEKSDVQQFREMMELPYNHSESIAFAKFCESVYASENLLFYRDVQQLKKEKSSRARDKMGKQIYAAYVGPGAPQAINLPHRSSELLHARFGVMGNNFFKKAETAVYQNLRSDLWVRYRGRTVAPPGNSSPVLTRKMRRSNSMSLMHSRKAARSPSRDSRKKKRGSLSMEPDLSNELEQQRKPHETTLMSKIGQALHSRRRSASLAALPQADAMPEISAPIAGDLAALDGGKHDKGDTGAAISPSKHRNRSRSRSSSIDSASSTDSNCEEGSSKSVSQKIKTRMRSGSFGLSRKEKGEKTPPKKNSSVEKDDE